jgi:glutaminase
MYKQVINKLYQELKNIKYNGEIASYIPELATVSASKFGIYLADISNNSFGIGDFEEKFSIQSISKVLSFCLAYKNLGEAIWTRLGVEPSGSAFNSLIQIETNNGIPRNPFINSGALVICDILISILKNPREEFLEFCREASNNNKIYYSEKIAKSEKSVGYRNIALCNLIKSFGNIKNDPNDILDFYFLVCSIELSCKDLAETFLFLANYGKNPFNNNIILTKSQAKRVNAIMQTCGLYDESGEFTYKVGLPGKSGVGGGIIAINPNNYCIAVWSPVLNKKGNSCKAMDFLEKFTTETDLSIF